MENVIATVSGYHGSERFKLIKLINQSGASYVGGMSRSITHLVCWKFEGQKYDLAKKFNTIVVNHQWVEECIREGKRVPERPYTFESGEEVGPLMIELPAVSEEAKVTKKLKKPTANFDKYFGDGEQRSGCTSELASWMDSVLLKEKNIEGNRHSSRSTRKRPSNISEDKENTGVAESSRKGKRRLVKQRSYRNVIDLESNEESDINSDIILDEQRNNTEDQTELDHENGTNYVFEPGETSALPHPGDSSTTPNRDMDEIEESENWSHSAIFKPPRSSERKLQTDGSNIKKAEETVATDKDSAQVSCIICWTEFSSTRGILPCGHRFCYSCIQNWADSLISQRKNTTCPLCKANFITITKIEDAGSSDQNIYSQTVPDPSTNDILVVLPEEGIRGFNPLVMSSRASACTRCFSNEPEDLLIRCHLCNFRRIHSYCLDPYLLPWTCNHCNDLQMLYHRRSY